MPVAAIHDAVEAESVDRVCDIGLELLARPVLVIGFGGDARNLAVDIRQARQLLEVLAPGIEDSGLDARLADMVEHEAHLRALADHLDRIRHLMVEDADVESEVVGGEQLEPVDEIGADAEIGIGLGLDQPPDAAQDLVLAQLIELAGDRLAALERQCRHHARSRWSGLREPVDPCGLGEMLREIDIDLDEDKAIDLRPVAAALVRCSGRTCRLSDGAFFVQP